MTLGHNSSADWDGFIAIERKEYENVIINILTEYSGRLGSYSELETYLPSLQSLEALSGNGSNSLTHLAIYRIPGMTNQDGFRYHFPALKTFHVSDLQGVFPKISCPSIESFTLDRKYRNDYIIFETIYMGPFAHIMNTFTCLQKLTVPHSLCLFINYTGTKAVNWATTVKEVCLHGVNVVGYVPIRTSTVAIASFLLHFPLANFLVLHSPYVLAPAHLKSCHPLLINHIRTLAFEGRLEPNLAEMTLPLFPHLTRLRFELYHPSYSPLVEVTDESLNKTFALTAFEKLLLREDDDSLEFSLCPLLEHLELSGLPFTRQLLLRLHMLMRGRAETRTSRNTAGVGIRLTLRMCTFQNDSLQVPIPVVEGLILPGVEAVFNELLLIKDN